MTYYNARVQKLFSKNLYMSIKDLKYLIKSKMYLGAHGFQHKRFSKLNYEEKKIEIKKNLIFLKKIGAVKKNWAMCYPYGSFNESLINILKVKNCKLALTTNVDIATISKENAYTLERLDTNDLPKNNKTQPNLWTRKVLH